jgi:hypothetical protein
MDQIEREAENECLDRERRKLRELERRLYKLVKSTQEIYKKVTELFGSCHHLKETNIGIDLRRSRDI